MRPLPEAMSAALQSGVTTFAHVLRIVRRDSETFAFTDHDRALAFDGLICEPSQGLAIGAIEKSLGLSTDTASVAGALHAEAITEADLARGLWDGARVELYRVDWREPSVRVHLFSGRIGEAKRGASAFEAELRGVQAPLNTPVGRVFSRYCDATLGDARCGKDISTSAFRGAGVVTSVLSSTAFRVSGLGDFEAGWFARGRLVWSAGGESEVAAHRLDGDEAMLELLDPAGAALSAGAAFVVYAGCDKSLATCKAKFANSVNFRGFPHMPGNDVVQAGPDTDEPLDGSSRFT